MTSGHASRKDLNSELCGISSGEKFERFRDSISRWSAGNGRDFPWRETRIPYRVLMAELMLRRTQARQVRPVYEHFLNLFPDVRALSMASDDEIYEVLSPLGLHWRIPSFRALARSILENHDGSIPS